MKNYSWSYRRGFICHGESQTILRSENISAVTNSDWFGFARVWVVGRVDPFDFPQEGFRAMYHAWILSLEQGAEDSWDQPFGDSYD